MEELCTKYYSLPSRIDLGFICLTILGNYKHLSLFANNVTGNFLYIFLYI